MGNYLLTDLDNKGKGFMFSRVFLVITVIVNMVLLLNMVIAIMANTYSRLTKNTSSLYTNEIIKVMDKYRYSSKYGALTMNSFALSVAALPFSFFFICCRKKNNILNSIFLHL